jgi:hypothetical protein
MLIDWLKRTYLEPVIRSLKTQAAAAYIEAIKGSRQLLILLCLLVFVITLVGAGLVLFPVGLTLLFTRTPQTVAIVGTVVAAVYLLVPLVAMRLLLSEKRWLAVTRAEETARRIME